ncbi:MAG TPA: hypothetical protein IAA32_04695 [Candidatus Butyricicoccus stercorigallinarum]|nr:hypothetical protein [Candidatus Butyricicoccus stercorigallinarum]
MLAVLFSLVLLAVIALGLWYFERSLARRPGRGAGLFLPAAFFVMSVVSIVRSAPAVFAAADGAGDAVLSLLLSFALINLPTLLTYVVYFRTRRKLGEARPWPLRPRESEGDEHRP